MNKEITIFGKRYELPLTLADQVVNWLDPVRGQERYTARYQMFVSGGGYLSADRTRRANQKGSQRELDADSAIIPDLQTLREDSQQLARNNPLGGGALLTNVTKVVGNGLFPKSKIDRDILNLSDDKAQAWEKAAEKEYLWQTETREIDSERFLPFSLYQGLCFLRVLEDGDVFVNMPRFSRPGSDLKLKLQMIEAARVSNPKFKEDNESLVAGVQKDKYGAPVRYHVCNKHPGNIRFWYFRSKQNKFSWQSVDAFNQHGRPLVLHLFDKKRPGQTRGVPYLAPVIELLRQLGRYTDAEVMAAVVSGMMTVFIKSQSGNPAYQPASTQGNPTGDRAAQDDVTGIEMGYASVFGVPDGTEITVAESKRPNINFDPFVLAIVRQIGVALELPFEVLIKHFTSSYSASRAALEDVWGYFMRRRNWLEKMLCQPVYEEVISEAVAYGRLSAPGFFSSEKIRAAWLGTQWVGDAKPQLDELKTINAAAKRVELTVSTLDEESRKLTGTPWEDKLSQILKERQILRDAGISISAYEQKAMENDDKED